MKVYVISVLHTKERENEQNELVNEIVASQPIAVFSDRAKAIETMQKYLSTEEHTNVQPLYNMFIHGDRVSCTLSEKADDMDGNKWSTEVTLRTIELDDEAFNIEDEVIAAWN
jgi:hypothetical protein